jgi:hypothetical protein
MKLARTLADRRTLLRSTRWFTTQNT